MIYKIVIGDIGYCRRDGYGDDRCSRLFLRSQKVAVTSVRRTVNVCTCED